MNDELKRGGPFNKKFLLRNIEFLAILFILIIWSEIILYTKSAYFHSADDLNFFGPQTFKVLQTGDWSHFSDPQGPHLHTFYKIQSFLLIAYMDWNAKVFPILGLLASCGFAWATRNKFKFNRGLVIYVNVAFFLAYLGHINTITFDYHMVSFSGPVTFILGAIVMYTYAKTLTMGRTSPRSLLILFYCSSIAFVWLLATAMSFFLLIGLGFMAIIILMPTFVSIFTSPNNTNGVFHDIHIWGKENSKAILGLLVFLVLCTAYYTHISTGTDTKLSNSKVFYPNLLSDLGVSSIGWTFTGGSKENLIQKGYIAITIFVLLSTLVFRSNYVSLTHKVFFTGVIAFAFFFGLGTNILRGQGAILTPRYISFLAIIWIVLIWLLGEVITKTKNKKSLETIIAFTGISLTLIFNSWSLNRVVEHNVYKKNYYSPRVITALKTPIEEITDIEMKTHLFCHRTRKECEILVLRMRCFSETHPKAICINGSKEELIGLIKRVN